MKNAIECFKYLLKNGYDDPNKTMEEQNPKYFYDSHYNKIEIKKYEWDCMATAIYFCNREIIKILEFRGIEKGKNPGHIEAAILSYQNELVEEILDTINEENKENKENKQIALFASTENNNIKVAQKLIINGADINTKNIIYLNLLILFLIKII